MNFSVVIPSLWNKENARRILHAIVEQTLQPAKIIFVLRVDIYTGDVMHWLDDVTADLWEQCSKDFLEEFIHKIEIQPIEQASASIARNIWIDNVHTPYVYLIDDDNTFVADFFATTWKEYQDYMSVYQQDILYSPTIMYRTTNRIQSRGIKTFHFIVGWPEPVQFGWWKNAIVSLLRFLFPLPLTYKNNSDYVRAMIVGGNSLFMSMKLAKRYTFDQNMPFVYEDLDMVSSMTQDNIPLIISKNNRIMHMEREKTLLETSFLATPWWAYQKGKNRILFVKKHGTLIQKILFWSIWLPITSLMTYAFILIHGYKQWRSAGNAILHAYTKWIVDGMKYKKKNYKEITITSEKSNEL